MSLQHQSFFFFLCQGLECENRCFIVSTGYQSWREMPVISRQIGLRHDRTSFDENQKKKWRRPTHGFLPLSLKSLVHQAHERSCKLMSSFRFFLGRSVRASISKNFQTRTHCDIPVFPNPDKTTHTKCCSWGPRKEHEQETMKQWLNSGGSRMRSNIRVREAPHMVKNARASRIYQTGRGIPGSSRQRRGILRIY